MARGDPRADVGYIASPEDFWSALRGVWFSPIRFFGGLDPRGGVIRPAIFASVVLYLDLLLETVLQQVWLLEFNYGLIYASFFGLVVAVVPVEDTELDLDAAWIEHAIRFAEHSRNLGV